MPTHKFSLINATDNHVCRSKIGMPRKPAWYPSEASATWTDENGEKRTEGQCMRSAYFRYTGLCKDMKLETTPYSEWIFALGKHVEIILVEYWKEMGLWVDNNLKFYDKERDISGEIDCLIHDPNTGELILVEVKSIYGYAGVKQVCGNKSTKASPKTSQMMQLMIYLDQFKDIVSYGKLVYYARDSAARNEFDISLVLDASDPQKPVHRPTIDGVIDYRFTLEDMYERYAKLAEHVKAGIIPDGDYEKVWSKEKVERRNLLGEVAKTTYAKWKKNPGKNQIGDWMCNYCRNSLVCLKQDGTQRNEYEILEYLKSQGVDTGLEVQLDKNDTILEIE